MAPDAVETVFATIKVHLENLKEDVGEIKGDVRKIAEQNGQQNIALAIINKQIEENKLKELPVVMGTVEENKKKIDSIIAKVIAWALGITISGTAFTVIANALKKGGP